MRLPTVSFIHALMAIWMSQNFHRTILCKSKSIVLLRSVNCMKSLHAQDENRYKKLKAAH